MASMWRRVLLSPALILAIVAAAPGVGPAAARADARAADPVPERRGADDVARVFRFHAGAQAEALRDALERAPLDDPLKRGLSELVARHLRRVAEEADGVAKAPAAPPAGAAPGRRPRTLDDVIGQAVALAQDFNDVQVARWLDEHPAAYQPVQAQIALAEAFQRAAAEEPDAIARAARAAGVEAKQEVELRKSLTAIRDRLSKAADADLRQLREAEPKGPPAPAPGKGGGASRDPLPPTAASPEAEAFELLGQLTDAEAHARLTAAGREARAEAEKLLTAPAQRKALDDGMLRWYQSLLPPEEAPRDGAQLPSRPAPPGKKPGAVDPGF